MAKDVDLSSKEWLDIVFDSKNKEFGAYQMRAKSTSRHTRSVIIVLIILAVILGSIIIVSVLKDLGVFNKADEDANAGVDQTLVEYAAEEEEEEDEEEQFIQEEEKIEMPKEEVANQIQNTIIDIVEDDKVENEVKNQEDLREDNRMMGATDISDGVDDLTKAVVKEEVIVVEEKKPEPEVTYDMANVQQKPEFPGGEAAMYKWLSQNINYPAQAAEEGISGRVTVQFVVSKSGSIENVKVVRGKHPALDKEAVDVVKRMPKWNPGRNNGQPVKVTYTLPINFQLQK